MVCFKLYAGSMLKLNELSEFSCFCHLSPLQWFLHNGLVIDDKMNWDEFYFLELSLFSAVHIVCANYCSFTHVPFWLQFHQYIPVGINQQLSISLYYQKIVKTKVSWLWTSSNCDGIQRKIPLQAVFNATFIDILWSVKPNICNNKVDVTAGKLK